MNLSQQQKTFPSVVVFCNQTFLHLLQISPFRPLSDSKALVDLPLNDDPLAIIHAFGALRSSLPAELTQPDYLRVLNLAFSSASIALSHSADLDHASIQSCIPPDYTDDPPRFLHDVFKVARTSSTNLSFIDFAIDLKRRWPDLCRRCLDVTELSLSRTSLISLPHPFFAPGGRFRECYYWDTLWTVKGLLACDMLSSAQNAVRNLVHLVLRLGFVPNGNRVYYLNRSQPPILTEAVRVICDALPPIDRLAWLRETIPALDMEMDFFRRSHSIAAIHPLSRHAHLSLAIYAASTDAPRPESFAEDVDTAARSTVSAKAVFRHLASGAESGWDFSSRWFPNPDASLCDIRTASIVPCCLNSILLRAERSLASFYRSLATSAGSRHADAADVYDRYAACRERDMNLLLWCPRRCFWFDFDLDADRQTDVVSCAGAMPLWASCSLSQWTDADALSFMSFLTTRAGLVHAGGIACTSRASQQQWDFPNCWPPLVDLVVEGLEGLAKRFPDCGAGGVARSVAVRFVRTVFRGWCRDGVVHEKYDCRSDDGIRGGGGEYEPQTGFGWTNGTVLTLLQKYLPEDVRLLETL